VSGFEGECALNLDVMADETKVCEFVGMIGFTHRYY
jgi:hypothetical protein